MQLLMLMLSTAAVTRDEGALVKNFLIFLIFGVTVSSETTL